ncbi:uncharacterized protein LOC134263067, partial [Saccostrea cucullata]|uniref:uncharacterized protein LOC134263067 n=1 Tax=Saccostrea cuccullata TaxID=36930 RepID=UPI002ED6B56E
MISPQIKHAKWIEQASINPFLHLINMLLAVILVSCYLWCYTLQIEQASINPFLHLINMLLAVILIEQASINPFLHLINMLLAVILVSCYLWCYTLQIEQASIHFSTYNGRLSPVSKLRKYKKIKEGVEEGDLNNNSTEEPLDGVKGQDGDLESSDGKDDNRSKNVSPSLQRILDGPYAQSNNDMVLKRHKTRLGNNQHKGKVISELE